MTARSSTGLLLGLTVAMLSISQSELAIAQDEEIKDLSTVSCRDVLLAHGEERDGVILVLHAYLLGEAKQLTYDANELAEATDSFFDASDYCRSANRHPYLPNDRWDHLGFRAVRAIP